MEDFCIKEFMSEVDAISDSKVKEFKEEFGVDNIDLESEFFDELYTAKYGIIDNVMIFKLDPKEELSKFISWKFIVKES